MSGTKQAEKAKQESVLQNIKKSVDYKKFNKNEPPKSCEVLEAWVSTLSSEPGLGVIKSRISGLVGWLAELRDQRMGFGLQNLMAGLFIDPILDHILTFQKKINFLNSEIEKLTKINVELRSVSDLNTSVEERQELRLLQAENAKLMTDSQSLLAKVQYLEAKENAMISIQNDIQTQLSGFTAPMVAEIDTKIKELNSTTEKTFTKLQQKEDKVLAQYKVFIEEVRTSREKEKKLVKDIQNREEELFKKFDQLPGTDSSKPEWVDTLLEKFASLAESPEGDMVVPALISTAGAGARLPSGPQPVGQEIIILNPKDFRRPEGSHSDIRPISSVINWKSMVSKYLEVKGIDLGTTPQEGSQED